jgi:hypothetical protein
MSSKDTKNSKTSEIATHVSQIQQSEIAIRQTSVRRYQSTYNTDLQLMQLKNKTVSIQNTRWGIFTVTLTKHFKIPL